MTELVKLEPWHIELMKSDGEIEPAIYQPGYANYVCQGQGYTLFVDGRIFGCAGVIPQWAHVGEGWAVITERARAKPILLCKSFKQKFSEICDQYSRVQITVEEGFTQAELFARYLGFSFEGRMPYYSPDGKTHLRFGRITPWLQ